MNGLRSVFKPALPKITLPLSDGPKFDILYFDDAGSFSVLDTAQYGLNKSESSEIDFYPTKIPRIPANKMKNFTGVFSFMAKKVIPPLGPRARQTVVIDPSMYRNLTSFWATPSTSSTIKLTAVSISDTKSEKSEDPREESLKESTNYK